jgi:high-affinity nickel-transport protein
MFGRWNSWHIVCSARLAGRGYAMDQLPATWTALCLLAFVLGLRHGFDADHLATIDGLTRCNARSNPRLARAAGSLFSLGHGAVVLLVALTAGTLSAGWQTPAWLEVTGATVSILFLFGLAFLNLRAVLVAGPDAIVAPTGFKAKLLGRFLTVRRSWAVAAVGALFALSFDTISQAALFALAATRFGGVADAMLVAGLFVLGMLVVDGVNGVWISQMLRRADRTAVIASRLMALTVAGISIAVGLLALAKLALPPVDAWIESRGMYVSGAVVTAVLTAFAVGMLAARRHTPHSSPTAGPLPALLVPDTPQRS